MYPLKTLKLEKIITRATQWFCKRLIKNICLSFLQIKFMERLLAMRLSINKIIRNTWFILKQVHQINVKSNQVVWFYFYFSITGTSVIYSAIDMGNYYYLWFDVLIDSLLLVYLSYINVLLCEIFLTLCVAIVEYTIFWLQVKYNESYKS